LGHKWGVDEIRKDLQLASIKSSAYKLCHANENVPHHSSEVCSAGLDFQSLFPQTDVKLQAHLFVPIT